MDKNTLGNTKSWLSLQGRKGGTQDSEGLSGARAWNQMGLTECRILKVKLLAQTLPVHGPALTGSVPRTTPSSAKRQPLQTTQNNSVSQTEDHCQ